MTGSTNAAAGRPVAWVTGASSGIGRAVALALADAGWHVAASARSADKLAGLAAERPGLISVHPLDITDPQAIAATVAGIEGNTGPIELALFSAGSYTRDNAMDFDIGQFADMLSLNLIGTAHCFKAALSVMAPRGRGKIALTASVAGLVGLPGGGAYGATKAAMINLAESFRPELERAGIILQVVNPGFVRTPLTDKNDFDMPFIISAEEAAAIIVKGLATDRFEIVFPWKMALSIKVLRFLPYRLFFAITRRMLRDDTPGRPA